MAGNRHRSRLRAFVDDYGWRAFAIPLLLAVTVVVVLQVARSPAAAVPVGVPDSSNPAGSFAAGSSADPRPAQGATGGSRAPGAPAGSGTMAPGLPPLSGAFASSAAAPDVAPVPAAGAAAGSSAGADRAALGAPSVPPPTGGTVPPTSPAAPVVLTPTFSNLPNGLLPAGAAFAAAGRDHWHVVPGSTPSMGHGPIRLTYTVEVEDGVGNPQQDSQFGNAVDRILADPHSWIGSGRYTLQRIASGTPSFRVSLTSQLTERRPELCGWDIQLEASCYARDLKRVSINDARWARGAMSFHGDLAAYRVYAINHEVGHALGYQHRPCPVAGGPAPVMMQQSWSTANDDLAQLNPQLIPPDDKVCQANPFPYPPGSGLDAAGPLPTGPLAPAVPALPVVPAPGPAPSH